MSNSLGPAYFLDLNPPENVVNVNYEYDFPNQDDFIITLVANTKYIFGKLIATEKRFIIEDGAMLEGAGLFNLVLIYTGTETMFTSETASWQMENFRFNCPNGTIFSKSGVGTILLARVACVSCEHFGNFSSGGQGTPNGFQVAIAIFIIKQTGIILTGEFSLIALREVFLIATTAGTVLLDWFDSSIPNFELNNVEFRGPVGAFALRADAGGVNMSPGSLGTIQNSTLGLPGTLTPLTGGLHENDPAYLFENTLGVIDSRAIGHAYVTTPAETDVLDGSPVQIAGIFAQGAESSQSTSSIGGTITMQNRIEQRGVISANIDLTKQTGSSRDYIICMQKDPGGIGSPSPVDGSCSTATLAGGGSFTIAIAAPVRFIDTDEFYVTITGVGTTENITASTENFKLIG